jgi:hypothetical protein
MEEYKMKRTIKSIIIGVIIISLVGMLLEAITFNVALRAHNSELIDKAEAFNEIESGYKNTIADYAQVNADQLATITQLTEVNNQLLKTKEALEEKSNSLETIIEKLKERPIIESSNRDFKTYMSYKMITNASSRQWELQQQATTGKYGIRYFNDMPMVAIGTGWGLDVGDVGLVVCENGNSFKVVVGDIKSNSHTDAENKTTTASGCRCEFIVDVVALDRTVKVMGNVATLSDYNGYVVSIVEVIE